MLLLTLCTDECLGSREREVAEGLGQDSVPSSPIPRNTRPDSLQLHGSTMCGCLLDLAAFHPTLVASPRGRVLPRDKCGAHKHAAWSLAQAACADFLEESAAARMQTHTSTYPSPCTPSHCPQCDLPPPCHSPKGGISSGSLVHREPCPGEESRGKRGGREPSYCCRLAQSDHVGGQPCCR